MKLGFQAPLNKIKEECGLDFEADDWESLRGYLHCADTSGASQKTKMDCLPFERSG
jgi:hypothetical protein